MSTLIEEGTQIASGTFTGKMDATTTVGCFASSTPLVDHGSYTFQSSGNCQRICYSLQMPVMGLTSGTNCSCGDMLPPKDSLVSSDKCNTGCVGYDKESCGGFELWWVILSGYSRNSIGYFNPSSSATVQKSQTTVGGSTIVITTAPSASSSGSPPSESPKSNTAGIAAGIIVGLVVFAALITGVWFFLRWRKQKMEEDEINQKQNVRQFVAGGRNPFANSQSSMNDNRLDHDLMTTRRQSDGSIMDNQDYSRRILQVTNPDGRN